jgi:hypothetical protein
MRQVFGSLIQPVRIQLLRSFARTRAHELASFATDQKEGQRRCNARRWQFLLPITYKASASLD